MLELVLITALYRSMMMMVCECCSIGTAVVTFLSPDVTIQMQNSVYIVSESSNTVVVCTILIGTSDLYNTVRLSTISSTAG